MVARRSPGGDRKDAGYQRAAALVTDQPVAPPSERNRSRRLPLPGRGGAKTSAADVQARADAEEVVAAFNAATRSLAGGLDRLIALRRPGLLGKAEEERARVTRAVAHLEAAREALDAADFGTCGRAVRSADAELAPIGGKLAIALDAELAVAALDFDTRDELRAHVEARQAAEQRLDEGHSRSPRARLLTAALLYGVTAREVATAADVLSGVSTVSARARPTARTGEGSPILAPSELETLADVGGLEEVKERVRRAVLLTLEPERMGSAAMAHNGILLYGVPGTGKTLLARAVAGELGLRFAKFSPADIASVYQREPAAKLREVFERAADAAPCVLLLDEVDAIGGRRDRLLSPDHREVVTQLLNSLEDYRAVPGLVLMAATNAVDELDPALREGRFDTRVHVPLPDIPARAAILEIRLGLAGADVAWDGVDLDEVAARTEGASGASLAALVTGALDRARQAGRAIDQTDLLDEINARSGRDTRVVVEQPVHWEDVVLPEATHRQLAEILLVFERPDLARTLGARAPAGILLYGPPGTGKTTIAKAMATEVRASFYEQSAAELLSKWVGESEQRVADLFARARRNRPSIVFCDEIDSLLHQRSASPDTPWEGRVVSQFLRELDGLQGGEGVLLVGATNRAELVDDAIRGRRLVPIEVPLPDQEGRERLFRLLCREMPVASEVDLAELAAVSHGTSGASLKSLCALAARKATVRLASGGSGEVTVIWEDFAAAAQEVGLHLPPSRLRRRRRPSTS